VVDDAIRFVNNEKNRRTTSTNDTKNNQVQVESTLELESEEKERLRKEDSCRSNSIS
jgi:hypothetical protein